MFLHCSHSRIIPIKFADINITILYLFYVYGYIIYEIYTKMLYFKDMCFYQQSFVIYLTLLHQNLSNNIIVYSYNFLGEMTMMNDFLDIIYRLLLQLHCNENNIEQCGHMVDKKSYHYRACVKRLIPLV